MTKTEKIATVENLTEQFRNKPNFYVVNMGGMSVEKTNKFRAKCHKSNLRVLMVKNKLIIKALNTIDANKYSDLIPALKQPSSIIFTAEDAKTPAQLIKEFRTKEDLKPELKGAYISDTVFIGDNNLETLANLKSKNDLIGEIIGLLQAPMSNVIGALQSGSQKIGGIIKTLSERKES